MHNEVHKILQNAQVRFASWLGRYKPWHGDNGITERNLSFQFGTAFLNLNPTGLAFMEVPFAAESDGPVRNHIDGYFHCENFDLLLECKVVSSESHIKAIVSDIGRMGNKLLHEQIQKSHLKEIPKKMYSVVLAETWYSKIVDWWKDKKDADLDWSREGFPQDWHYGVVEVLHLKDENKWTLYWLYGVSPAIEVTMETYTTEH